MAREAGERIGGVDGPGDVRDPGCDERELAVAAGRRDRDEREREGLSFPRAEVGRCVGRRSAASRPRRSHRPPARRASGSRRSAAGRARAAAPPAPRPASAGRRRRRWPRKPAPGRTDAPRCSLPARDCACGGRRSARSRCRRHRASNATPRHGSTNSACAGRGCRPPCPGCEGAGRPPGRLRSRQLRRVRRGRRRRAPRA